MTDAFVPLVVSVVGGTVGAAATYWFWSRQHRQEILRSYDQELRTARFKAYRTLWQEFEPLAVYLPDTDITYERVVRMGVAIRGWYFHKGGLLLTERARNAYFLVQDAIDRVSRSGTGDKVMRATSTHWTNKSLDDRRRSIHLVALPPDGSAPDVQSTWEDRTSECINAWTFGDAPDDDFVLLQSLVSSLRTILARDLHARNPSILDRRQGGRQSATI